MSPHITYNFHLWFCLGVYRDGGFDAYIDIKNVKELNQVTVSPFALLYEILKDTCACDCQSIFTVQCPNQKYLRT